MATLYPDPASSIKPKRPGGIVNPDATTNAIPAPVGTPEATNNTAPAPAPNPAAATNTETAIAPPPQIPQTAAPVAPAAPVPPTPTAPKPAPDWVPTQDGQGWVPPGHPQAWQASSAAPAAGTPGAAPNSIAGAFQDALLKQLQQSPTVGADDPSISGSIKANSLAQQRAVERQRAVNAQAGAQAGTDMSGGQTTDNLALERDRANQEGGFEAQQIGNATQQRQAQLMQTLALGGQYLSDQDKLAAQKQLAEMDADIRRQGLASQTALGQGDLNLRGRLGDMQGQLGLLGLLQGGQQFGQGLSAENARFSAGLNQKSLMDMLQGLS